MITRIQNSLFARPTAILLAAAFLLMSFRMAGDDKVQLKAGSRVSLETVSMIHSDEATVGQMVDFRVIHDVEVAGQAVITAGSIARGQVVRAEREKGIGAGAVIQIEVKSVTAVDGQEVFLTGGNIYREGEDKQTLSIVLGIFVCLLFLIMKGESVTIPSGYQVSASVATTMSITP